MKLETRQKSSSIKNKSWLDKYRPNSLNDYMFSNIKDFDKICSWMDDFINGVNGTPAILILYGSPGVGKTTLSELIFKKYRIDYVEFNASDCRSKKSIYNILNNITKYI